MENSSNPPEEKKLPAPEEKLLRAPTLTEKYGKKIWLIPLVLFIISLLVGYNLTINKPSPLKTPQLLAPTQTVPSQAIPATSSTILLTPTNGATDSGQATYPIIETTNGWKTYKFQNYQISTPDDFEIDTHYDSVPKSVSFQKNDENVLKSKRISIEIESAIKLAFMIPRPVITDPCEFKPRETAKCITINGYKAMDWGNYDLIYNDFYYHISFSGLEKTEKDQILTTLKFLDNPQSVTKILDEAISPDKTNIVKIFQKTDKDIDNRDFIQKYIVLSDISELNKKILLYDDNLNTAWDYIHWSPDGIFWSPDNKYIAINVTTRDGFDIYVFKTDGSIFSNNQTKLSAGAAYGKVQYTDNIHGGGTTEWISNNQIKISNRNPGTDSLNVSDIIFDVEKEIANAYP